MNWNRAILLDGGMGQELVARGIDPSGGLWSAEALLNQSELVRDTHRAFIDAGADVVTTHSYATNPRRIPDRARFERMNRVAGQLANEARAASGRDVRIAGSLPPMFGSYLPGAVRSEAELLPMYRAQARLLAPYVDVFLCETMSTAAEGRAAALAALEHDRPVWVAWTLADDASGLLRSGETLAAAAAALDGLDVEAILVNCSVPEAVTAAMADLARVSPERPFGGYANGFAPIPAHGVDDGRHVPPPRRLGPETYADFAASWLEAGARLVGGCCEVGPAHIAALRELVSSRAELTASAHRGRPTRAFETVPRQTWAPSPST